MIDVGTWIVGWVVITGLLTGIIDGRDTIGTKETLAVTLEGTAALMATVLSCVLEISRPEASIGKRLTSLAVVGLDKEPIGRRTALHRFVPYLVVMTTGSASYFLSFGSTGTGIVIGVVFLTVMTFFTWNLAALDRSDGSRTLGDLIANTEVIMRRRSVR